RRPPQPRAGEAPAAEGARRLPGRVRPLASRRLPLRDGDGGRAVRPLLVPQGGTAADDGRARGRLGPARAVGAARVAFEGALTGGGEADVSGCQAPGHV